MTSRKGMSKNFQIGWDIEDVGLCMGCYCLVSIKQWVNHRVVCEKSRDDS